MDTIEQIARAAGRAAVAEAAARTDIDGGLQRILAVEGTVGEGGGQVVDGGVRAVDRRPDGSERSFGRRWPAAAAAAALIAIAGVAAALVVARRGDAPTIAPGPTAGTFVPVPTTALPSTTFTSTTAAPSSTTVPQEGSGLRVSYLDPPEELPMRSLGTFDGDVHVVVGDTGVVVGRVDLPELTVVSWDGSRTTLTHDVGGDLSLLAAGPGDVVYGFVADRLPMPLGHYVAIALSGPRAGEVVGTALGDANEFIERAAGVIGRGSSAVVRRTDDLRLIEYVDENGTPLGDVGTPDVRMGGDVQRDGRGNGVVSRTDGSMSWNLEIDAAADAGLPYDGWPAPVPTADGGAVLWRGIGPPVADGGDYPPSTVNVIAFLAPDGSARWYSIPDGWTVAAMDLGGVVLRRDEGGTTELAVPDPTVGTETDGSRFVKVRSLAHTLGVTNLVVREDDGSRWVVAGDRIVKVDARFWSDGEYLFETIDDATETVRVSDLAGRPRCEVRGSPTDVETRPDGGVVVTVVRWGNTPSVAGDAEVPVPRYTVDCTTGAEESLEPTTWLREGGGRAVVTVADRTFVIDSDVEGTGRVTNEAGLTIEDDDLATSHTFSTDGSIVAYLELTGEPSPHWGHRVRARDTTTGALLWSLDLDGWVGSLTMTPAGVLVGFVDLDGGDLNRVVSYLLLDPTTGATLATIPAILQIEVAR